MKHIRITALLILILLVFSKITYAQTCTSVLFSGLPSTKFSGQVCSITDATVCVNNQSITVGGGNLLCTVLWNGTNWIGQSSNPASDRSASGTPNAVGNTVAVNSQSASSTLVNISANTNVTFIFEGYDGANWFTATAYPYPTGTSITSTTSGGTGQWMVPCAGMQQVRVRVTAIGATPSSTVNLNASSGSTPHSTVALNTGTLAVGTLTDSANGSTGSAVPSKATYVAGTDGTNLRGLSTDSSGNLNVKLGNGTNTNQNVNLNQIAGTAILTATAGSQKVGITGNTGAAMDAAGQNVAQPANELLIGGEFNTTPTTITSGNMSPLQLDNTGDLLCKVNVALPTGSNVIGALSANQSINIAQVNGAGISVGGTGVMRTAIMGANAQSLDASGQNVAAPSNELLIGGEFNTTPTTITSGNMSPLQLDNAGDLLSKINVALPTGSNTIGAVTQASGPWTSNVTQINSAAISTAASGTQKVGITGNTGAAMDAAGQNVAVPANELLVGAEFVTTPTTLTTGDMSPLQMDNAGNLLAKINVALPTGSNTIGAVTQASGPWTSNITQINSAAISTAASGVQKVGITGNAGAIFDAAGQNVAQPANEILTGGEFNTTPTTITSGNMSPLQLDNAGDLLTKINVALPTGSNTIGALSANQSVNVNQISGAAVSTAASGIQKVGVTGNAGAVFDAATGAAVPANAVAMGVTDGTNLRIPATGSAASVSGSAGTALTANTQANGTAQWSNIPVYALVGVDPCQSSAFVKTNKVLAVSGTSAVELVATVANKTIFVCSIWADIEGTAPTMLFQTGTKTTNPCDTSTASLTGTMAPTSGIMTQMGPGATIMTSANGGEVCVTLGGTTPKLNGVMTYVQQ